MKLLFGMLLGALLLFVGWIGVSNFFKVGDNVGNNLVAAFDPNKIDGHTSTGPIELNGGTQRTPFIVPKSAEVTLRITGTVQLRNHRGYCLNVTPTASFIVTEDEFHIIYTVTPTSGTTTDAIVTSLRVGQEDCV